MSTWADPAPKPAHTALSKLDASDPLLKAVVREVSVDRGNYLVRPGDLPRTAHLLLEGQMCRYRLLRDGRRQITAMLVPGDICDLEAAMRGRGDYFVKAFAPSVLGEMPADHLDGSGEIAPDVRRVVWRQLLRDEAIAREWMVGLGQRSAIERLAHLICELRERMRKVGLGEGDSYKLHLRQIDLADALGSVRACVAQLSGMDDPV